MRTRLGVLALVLAAAAALLAQTPATLRDLEQSDRRPVPNAVRIEVYPTSDGRIVDDLQQGEVKVFEDNVQQTVTSFAHVNEAGPSAPKLFVLFLDNYHLPLDVAGGLRMPLVRFIDRLAGPDDLVAVMTPDMSPSDVPVSRKEAVISNIMQDVTSWARSGHSVSGNDSKDDQYAGCYDGQRRAVADEMIERRHEMLAIDALDNLVAQLERTRPERKAVVAVTDGWRVFTTNPALMRDETRSRIPGIFSGPGGRGGRGGFGGHGGAGDRPRTGDTNGPSSSDLAECETDRAMLAKLDDSTRIRRLVDDANRATVTLYPIFASGVAPVPKDAADDRRHARGDTRQASGSDRAATLRELAENTDGVAAVDEKGLDSVLARITADVGSYYLLSYSSSNSKLDGRFRAIAVQVARPGVRVRTRRGYRGVTAEELAESTTVQTNRASTPAAISRASIGGHELFRVRTAAWYAPASAGATMWIVGELDYKVRKDLAWSAGASGDVTVLAPDGREISSHAVDVRPADGRFSIRLPDGDMPVAPGEYAVRVRLHPDAEPATTVTETTRVQVSKAPSIMGEPVIWRRGPSTGPQFMMTADPRFERTERIRVEVPTTSQAAPVARLMDRTGNTLPLPVQVSTREEPDAAFHWIVADLTLAPLGVGDYGIEVTAGGSKQAAPFALVP